jgi:O-antigen/teichoic acid export membrane protein
MPSRLKSAAYNTIVVYIGKLVGIIISTVTLGLVTRYLGVKNFGDYATILAFSAIVVSVADLGIGWLITRELAVGNEDAFIPLQSFKYVISLVIVVGAVLLSSFLGYDNQVRMGIIMIAVYTWLTSLNGFQVGVLQGLFSLSKTVYADTSGRIVGLIGTYLIIHFQLGFYAILGVLDAVSLVNYAANAFFIVRLGMRRRGFDIRGIRDFRFDLLTMPIITALSYIVYKVDTLILAHLATPTAVGVYGAGYRILDVAMAVPSIFVGTLAPVIAHAIASNDASEREKVFKFSSSGVAFLAGISMTLGVLFAGLAVRVVAGQSFVNAYTIKIGGVGITSTIVLQILSIYLFFSFLGSFFSSTLLAAKEQIAMIWVGVAGLVFNVVGNFVLIPHYQYFASALLTLFTEWVMISVMVYFLRRTGWLIGIGWIMSRAALLAGLMIYLGFWLEARVALELVLVIIPVLYVALSILVGKEERRMFKVILSSIKVRFQHGSV